MNTLNNMVHATQEKTKTDYQPNEKSKSYSFGNFIISSNSENVYERLQPLI